MANQNRNIIRVISDLHLGSHWHTKENVAALDVCLNECMDPGTCVHTIVIGGDIIEQWLVPSNEDVPDCAVLFEDERVAHVVTQLLAVAKNGVQVYYLRGNHDDELDTPSIKAAFGDAITIVEGEELILNGCRFIHGHWYDLMSQPYHAARFQRPAAYYLSRCAAHSGNMQDRPAIEWLTFSWLAGNSFFKYFMMLFYLPKVPEYFIQFALTISFQDKWENIKDETIKLRNGNEMTMGETVKQYAGIINAAKERYGTVRSAAMFRMSLSGNVGHWMRRSPYLVEVAGHTHMAKLRTYMRYHSMLSDGSKSPTHLDTKVLYANSGCFTGGESTFVDILLARTTTTLGWANQLPPYLFGLQHPRQAQSYYNTYLGGPPHGLTPHTWDRQGSVAAEWDGDGAKDGIVLPYEVRLYEWRKVEGDVAEGPGGGYHIRKAKRVPYRFDPSSIGKQGGKGDDVNAYKVSPDAAYTMMGNDIRVGKSVTGTGAPDKAYWVTERTDAAENEV